MLANNLNNSKDTKKEFSEYWRMDDLDIGEAYKKGFTQFPNLLFLFMKELGISGSKSTLAILLLYLISRDFKKIGSCFPGHQQMARDLDTSPGTIGRNLKALERLGLTEIGNRISERGQMTNVYSWNGLMKKLRELMIRHYAVKVKDE